ncbi:MAG: DUF896 domain-containing protein [Clostridiaceae bacterium]
MTELELMTLPHDKLVEMINNFTKLSRERELTEGEAAARQEVRSEYIRRIRINLTGQLEGLVPMGGADKSGNGQTNN